MSFKTIRKPTMKLFLFYNFFFVGEIVGPYRPRLIVYNSSNNLMILSTILELNFYFQASHLKVVLVDIDGTWVL